ncbi:glycosyltransferase [Dietzia natronolimnaea]|uniref:glycosyltransferase n=1 Tax=Dietzia natronolimnaea TaxID=161920 RepID=UPI0011410A90|nr:glycosyltransferase [Dietzia natronolimnaea]
MNVDNAIHFVTVGNWSGGGNAFLNNAKEAAARHDVLNGGPESVPMIVRNTPTPLGTAPGPFMLAPQNAWPWRFAGATHRELARVLPLRLASERTMRKRIGLLRISSAIPERGDPKTMSPVIHNVLDSGYEAALLESSTITVPEAQDAIVCLGSVYSYRNMDSVVRAYERYVTTGGNAPLFLAGAPGDRATVNALKQSISSVSAGQITLVEKGLKRAECLAAFRDARVVIQSSVIEASPFSVLESLSVNSRTVLSNISANREILRSAQIACGSAHDGWFPARSPISLADALSAVSRRKSNPISEVLSDPRFREQERDRWGDAVAKWVTSTLEHNRHWKE